MRYFVLFNDSKCEVDIASFNYGIFIVINPLPMNDELDFENCMQCCFGFINTDDLYRIATK